VLDLRDPLERDDRPREPLGEMRQRASKQVRPAHGDDDHRRTTRRQEPGSTAAPTDESVHAGEHDRSGRSVAAQHVDGLSIGRAPAGPLV
jgi:hypothetical protein